jgi:hypothetical protein
MKLYPLVLILSGIFLLAACGAGNPYPLVPGANPGVTAVAITAQPLITSTAWPTNVTTPQMSTGFSSPARVVASLSARVR